ncbi:MAG: hypothetical protein OJF55_000478 [Rhodanobacteraceae bacterium]|nr:MAG: hypothetical protein OJF55_000478 [Rhodanobacteraceae bacterium]
MKLSRTTSYHWASLGLAIALACGTTAAPADPPNPPHYIVTDLGTLPGGDGFSLAYGINNQGQIDGTSLEEVDGNFVLHSFVIEGGKMIDLGTLGGQNSQSFANVNASGTVGGEAELAIPDPNSENFCGFGTNLTCVGFIWKDGEMYGLTGLGGPNNQAAWINNRGVTVGYAETMVRDTACPPSPGPPASAQVLHFLPVVWRGLEIERVLPLPKGDAEGVAFAISNRGEVVGASGYCALYDGRYGVAIQPQHALLWRHGRMIDLGNLGGHYNHAANAINDRGEVVGSSGLPGDDPANGPQRAFLWRHGKMTNLGALPGDTKSAAVAINNRGQITGVSLDKNGDTTGILWQDGKMYDLNDLIPANSPLYLMHGFGINDRGQIVGMAYVWATGNVHAFLATPVQADKDNQAAIGSGIRKIARFALPARTRALIAKWMRASHVHGMFALPSPQLASTSTATQ